ncbi:amino acid lyase [Lacrimispora xylanolytica]|uniref:Aminotransferase class I/II-fold pyridoxal phosphate-dependent enzyme n=1 Tax=Lacrimispora xylanolytica TaxID=29375 RepID=A0ABY7AEL1_9FIRM|nr:MULTISPECIES: aminotransferase class I/II-fold pyridoxal phosphate-dependent enzyme [Clostridia]WAJ24775.1 aminotransferase class I/II-fold pyridoxal phosphate-dependent enzyme [Lacrimispora xylanolytica]
MYSFNNDYSEGAHPKILEAMIQANLIQNGGYGLDDHCSHARELIREEIGQIDSDIHFITGGTQTNLITIAAALRPWQAVISTDKGHINVHETGAIEATGHKVIAMPSNDGKLTPADILKALEDHTTEHMVQPKMVYISNSTEIGTQYTKAELESLHHICRQKDLYLFLDGARLGSALTSPINDVTISDIAKLTDAFYIGGTKNGALFGEALIILHKDLKQDLRFLIKQRGAMMAKGWLLGIQFEELFQNNLFYDLAAHANEMATLLRDGISSCGFSFYSDSMTNQLFPIFPDKLIEKLEKDFLFSIQERFDNNHSAIRLVTSWATKEEACREFIKTLKDNIQE